MFKMNQFEPISGKKLKVYSLRPIFKTPRYFFETEYNIFKTLYKYFKLNRLENIQIRFFDILINIKHSSYDCIYKSQKILLFIK
jgi:hypothetical protein